MTRATGKVAGMPVIVDAYYDNEEWQCPGCMRRFVGESLLIAHVMQMHRYLVRGGNQS